MPKKTLKIVKTTNNDAIVQVKENQKKLFERCKQIGKYHDAVESFRNFEKSRNRQETRIAEVYEIPTYLFKKIDKEWRTYIEVIVKITRIRKVFNTKTKLWEKSMEKAYYISTTKLPAKKFNEIIRSHWKIENTNHHVRDVTFREDASRIRKNPQNFAKLRSFALNILRSNNIQNIAYEIYKNSLSFYNIRKYKNLFT